jgi:hypothetical protein
MEIPRQAVHPSGDGWIVLSLYGSDEAWQQGRVVIFCHGFSGNRIESRRLFVREARMLARTGLAAVTFDYRGNGESTGEFHEMSVSTLRADALAAIQFVRETIAPNPPRLGLLGYSMGGMVASLTAGRKPEGLQAIALWAGVACYPSVLHRVLGCTIAEALETFEFPYERDGWPMSRKFFEEAERTCPAAALVAARKPVLILHALDDPVVEPENAREFQQTLSAGGVEPEMELLTEGGHGFGGWETQEHVLARTRDFFLKHL